MTDTTQQIEDEPVAPEIIKQTGLETPSEDLAQPEGKERAPSLRESAMEAVALAREAQLREEVGIQEDAEPPSDEAPTPEAEAAQPPAESAPAPDDQMVTVVVDGVETQVPYKEIVDSYQLRSAAAARMTEATQMLQAAREVRDGPVAQPPQAEPARAPDPQAAPRTTADLIEAADADFDSFIEGVQFEDKDKAKASAKALFTGIIDKIRDAAPPQGGSATPEEMQRIYVSLSAQFEADNARVWFEEQYPEIMSDPMLHTLWAKDVRDRGLVIQSDYQANGTPRPSYRELFKQAGDYVVEWRKGHGDGVATDGTETTPASTSRVALSPARLQAKREALPAIPSRSRPGKSTGGAQPGASQPIDGPTPARSSETIREMQKQRRGG